MSLLPLEVVILAAGKGTRMRSARAKVLHPLAGRPMIAHVMDTAMALAPAAVHVVVGHDATAVEAAVRPWQAHIVQQGTPQGTGHAVACALPAVKPGSLVLVLYGDVPLVRPQTLAPLIADAAERQQLALLTVEPANVDGYGRILRRKGTIIGVVEHRDATEAQRRIREVNTGLLAAPADTLRRWVGALAPNNAQREYYLTDIVALAAAEAAPISGHVAPDPLEVAGINSHAELALAERAYQRTQAHSLLAHGVRLADPARLDIRGRVEAGHDVAIDVGVVLEGHVVLEDNAQVGAYSVLRDVHLGRGARVEPHSVLDGARVGPNCVVGPFARLRPGTVLGAGVHVGNFVEIKKSELGAGSKANHLSYLGDSIVGARVNIGAGVITCNYDGARKHQTVIGDDAFIGSDSQLIAPVSVGPGATIGAGSTITADAPGGTLTLSRTRQKSVAGWRRPAKKEP